jgi:hypothetical protein
MKVVDRCSLVLQANVDDTTTVKYSTLNPGVGRMHMGARVSGTVSSGKYELAFEDSGKKIWGMSSSRGSSSFSYSRHHSHLHLAKMKPAVKFFAEVNLPEYIAEQGPDGTYGKSKITVAGIE